jgi:hypothetical protein
MSGDRYSLVKGSFCFKNDVASDLMNDPIVPVSAKKPDQVFSAQVSRKLHPFARISSRTR